MLFHNWFCNSQYIIDHPIKILFVCCFTISISIFNVLRTTLYCFCWRSVLQLVLKFVMYCRSLYIALTYVLLYDWYGNLQCIADHCTALGLVYRLSITYNLARDSWFFARGSSYSSPLAKLCIGENSQLMLQCSLLPVYKLFVAVG